MSVGNKYLLRSILADLLNAYEELSAHQLSPHIYDSFILNLEKSFNLYFSDVIFEKHHTPFSDNEHTTPSYIVKFSIYFDNSIETQYITKNFIITYLNLECTMSLIGRLKECIKHGYYNILFISEKNVSKTTTFSADNKETPKNDNTIQTFKITQHSGEQSEVVDAFFIDLVTAGAIDAFDDYSIAADFLSDSYEFLTDFVRSALINYHIAYDDLRLIHICKVCGKIFLPQKSGEQRGIFCSIECKNLFYKANNKPFTNCIQNQKNRINTMATSCSSKESDDLISQITLPAIDDCRSCPSIRSLEQERSVKAGNCPILLKDKHYTLLTEAYLKYKESKKLKKKKHKTGDDGEYHVLL